ncbi:MAG: hypothetical protein F6K19_18490 [Cyanothece sp. SIO1E1]|nr:hypothetical protein [Cyanothece sp. SIO1E1]
MDDYLDPAITAADFRKECSVRRTARVLELKKKSIQDELEQLLKHMALLVPSMETIGQSAADGRAQLLEEALERLGDQAFTDLVLQVMNNLH